MNKDNPCPEPDMSCWVPDTADWLVTVSTAILP